MDVSAESTQGGEVLVLPSPGCRWRRTTTGATPCRTRETRIILSSYVQESLADTYFFETVVRVHRAGEGAPYTGLKPGGQELGPAVPAADQAILSRSPVAVEKLLVDAVRKGHRERLERVSSRPLPGENVAEGREWVEAYVPYVHWVEGVYQAATAGSGVHPEPAAAKHAHGEPAPAQQNGKH